MLSGVTQLVNHARKQVARDIVSCVAGHLLTRVVQRCKLNCVTLISFRDSLFDT